MAEQVQQVTKKDPKKVEAGRRFAEYNCRKREQMKTQKSKSETKLPYYGAGAVVAIGASGVIGYYSLRLLRRLRANEAPVHRPKEVPDKFYMD